MLWFEILKTSFIDVHFFVGLSCAIRNNENCAKWSDIVVTMFSEIVSSVLSVVNILSIRVFDHGLKSASVAICGTRDINTLGHESQQCWSRFCILVIPH